MPGFISHLYMANNVYHAHHTRWFKKDVLPYFLAGVLGPDMGYFPNTDSFLSDLCHYVRSKDLVMNMLSNAKTDEEKAFAYGWLLHIYGDVLIHPFINRKVSEQVKNFKPDDYDLFHFRPKLVHTRLEYGFDIRIMHEDDFMKHMNILFPSRSVSKHGNIIQHAFFTVYCYHVSAKNFSAVEKTAPWMRKLPFGFSVLGLLPSKHAVLRALQWLVRHVLMPPVHFFLILLKKPVPAALVNPTLPSDEEMQEYKQLIHNVEKQFLLSEKKSFKALKNYNLDTGGISIFGKNKHADLAIQRWQALDLKKVLARFRYQRNAIKQYLNRFYKKHMKAEKS